MIPVVGDDFVIAIILLLAKTYDYIFYCGNSGCCEAVNLLFGFGEILEITENEGIGVWTLPMWMLNFEELFLCYLAPFDASETDESTQVYPVNEGRFEQVLGMLMTDGFHVMDHFVVYHVPAVGLFLEFLDRLQNYGDVVDVRVMRGGKLAVCV